MKRSLMLLSVLFTGLCNNLVYSAQSAAASTNSSAPATPAANPGCKVANMRGLFDQETAAPQASPIFHSPSGRPISFAALHLQRNPQATVTIPGNIGLGLAGLKSPLRQAQPVSAQTNWKSKLKTLASKRWVLTAATLVAVVCGLTLGETKYKMVSRLFKKAPATIPAKAVKVSWLKSLTGLSVR